EGDGSGSSGISSRTGASGSAGTSRGEGLADTATVAGRLRLMEISCMTGAVTGVYPGGESKKAIVASFALGAREHNSAARYQTLVPCLVNSNICLRCLGSPCGVYHFELY